MTLRVINNGFESFRETTNRVKVNNMFRTVYSHRFKGEHKEYIVFLLLSELKNASSRYLIVDPSEFVTKQKENV